MKRVPPYLWILMGLLAGLIYGIFSVYLGWGNFNTLYLKPIGDVFLRLLQMLAIPLILTSLILGIAQTGNLSKLGKTGGKTLLLFFTTALISTTLGVILANTLIPDHPLTEASAQSLKQMFSEKVSDYEQREAKAETQGLEVLTRLVPENIFKAFSENESMLQVVLISVLLGIALLKTEREKTHTLYGFLEGLNEVLLKLVKMIMWTAPVCVFCILSATLSSVAGSDPDRVWQLLLELLRYSLTVLLGLALILFVLYPLVIKVFSGTHPLTFFKGMRKAFIMAFSSSSSNATLPTTMECVEQNLHIRKEISGFVLPFGTTINMDGTALYQSIAAIFIAKVFGLELSLLDQVFIIFTAIMSAIGAAGIPSAGLITLIMVLKSTTHPIDPSGLAFILLPDRILDMCRTVVNVAGDATACLVVQGKTKA